MMLVATVCWYDEPIESLARLVDSLSGVVDEAIFLDGAYARFPHVDPLSPLEQHDAIRELCDAADIVPRVHGCERAWPSQVAKRTRLCELVPLDAHFLVIDADEYLDRARTEPDRLRTALKTHAPDTTLVTLDTLAPAAGSRRTRRTLGTQSPRMSTSVHGRGIGRIYRRLHDMRVGPLHHGSYSGVNEHGQRIALRARRHENSDLEPGVVMDASSYVRIVNETWQRDHARLERKHAYGTARRRAGEDL